MSTTFAPFTVHEADFALYLQGADGNAAGEVWLGGCLQDVSFSRRFETLRIEAHGEPYARRRHVNEEHAIEISQLWALHRSLLEMAELQRAQQYVLVVRFEDPDTGAWTLRTYYGVQEDESLIAVKSQACVQDLTLSASFMVNRSGYQDAPALLPLRVASLRYINGPEVVDLYDYDFESNTFSVIDAGRLPGRATIVTNSSKWELQFAGVPALRVTSSEFLVKKLTAAGATFPTTAGARVEFWRGSRRCATVTAAGEFVVPNFREVSADPEVQDFEIKVNGSWRAGIGDIRTSALATIKDSL